MNTDELTKCLKRKLLRANGQRRLGVLIGDCERRIGTALFQNGLARRYYVDQYNHRMLIIDKWHRRPVAEICLDTARGYETRKAFVYDLMVVGFDGQLTPEPLIRKGASHGSR